jgi:hypothetical protein
MESGWKTAPSCVYSAGRCHATRGELDSKLTNASGGSRGENEILMHPKIVSALDGRRADVSLRKAGRHFVRAASERMS